MIRVDTSMIHQTPQDTRRIIAGLDTYDSVLARKGRPIVVDNRAHMERMSDALQVSTRHLKPDTDGLWYIVGKHGTITTNDDGKTFVFHVTANSRRKFSGIRRRLSAVDLEISTDSGVEGTVLLEVSLTEKQAKVLRNIIGLKKRPSK